MSMNDLYQEIILDHARSPRHSGLREPFASQTFQVNPTCGDEVTLRLHLAGDTSLAERTISDISYEAVGCSISQASVSVMGDLVIGRTVAQARELDAAFESMVKSKGQDAGSDELLQDAVAFAGVSQYVNRVKCALLGWKALMAAIETAPTSQQDDISPSRQEQ